MPRYRINMKATAAKIKAQTEAIVVGQKYFLSSFYDSDGMWVKVLSKSTKSNGAGWPSSVEYEVIEPIGESAKRPYYQPGKIGTCNASNLYPSREAAAHTPARAAAMISAMSKLTGVDLAKYAPKELPDYDKPNEVMVFLAKYGINNLQCDLDAWIKSKSATESRYGVMKRYFGEKMADRVMRSWKWRIGICRERGYKPMLKVQKRQCASCIYRPESPLDLKKLEAEIADPYGGFKGYRICHHSDDAVCNGFWSRHRDKFQLGQIAQRLNCIQFVEVDTLK